MTAKRLTKAGKARKEQLMKEAAKLFAASGYYATRVIDIVKSAGVAKGLFYWYFENKEALFREIVTATRDDLRRAQAKAIHDETDPVRKISKGIEASLEFIAENEQLQVLLRFAGSQERFASLIEQAQEIHALDTAEHIQAAMDADEIPPGDPVLLAHGVVATVFHFARLESSTESEAKDPDLTNFIIHFSLQALGAPDDRIAEVLGVPKPLGSAKAKAAKA